MPRGEMFGDVVEPSIKVGSQKWYTVPLSIVVHTALIGAVIIIPLMAADVLPSPPNMMNAFVAAPPPTAATAATAAAGCGAGAPKPQMDVNPAAAPVEAPSEIKPETGIEQGVKAVGGVEGGVVGGVTGGSRRRARSRAAAAALRRLRPRRFASAAPSGSRRR